MATYNDLRNLFSSDDLRHKIEVAVCVKAHDILGEASPSTERLNWASSAFTGTTSEANRVLRYLLADNKDTTVSNIKSANDATIQTAVGDVIDVLYA